MKATFTITLPTDLNDKIIYIGFSKAQLSKVYRFIHAFRRINRMNKVGIYIYMPLPSTLIKKLIGSNYRVVLDKLIAGQIIDVHSWWNGERWVESYDVGRCRKYRLNPQNINSNFTSVSYQDAGFETKGYIRINGRKCKPMIVTDDIKGLIVNSRKLLETTNDFISSIGYRDIQIDNEIQDSKFCVKNHYTGIESWFTHEQCMHYINKKGWTLIKDGRNYYIDDLDRYIEMKKRDISWSYNSIIKRLSAGSYYAGRNGKNKRLDHNLTSMPKRLMSVLITDNKLCEIDLKNSQFAILAHLMKKNRFCKKTKDFELFCEITANGKLYEYIQNVFGLLDRDEAKTIMMELAFSSHRHHSPNKKKLQQIFPTVVNFINAYKKRAVKLHGPDGHKKFAIWLQRTEAKIFIDNLYFELKLRQRLFILTKHDSVIIKKHDESYVRDFMQRYFASINFCCKIN